MLILLTAVTVMGLLMKFVLIPGYKRNEIYGNDVELHFIGLTRHEWGSIHLVLSIILISFIVVHVILHLTMIASVFRRMISDKPTRVIISSFTGIIVILLVIAPFFIKPHIAPKAGKYMLMNTMAGSLKTKQDLISPNDLNTIRNRNPDHESHPGSRHKLRQEGTACHHKYGELEIYGYMTLSEVCNHYQISVTSLAEALNIPSEYADKRLGILIKHHDCRMNNIREAVIKLAPAFSKK